jgi:hypothetical protein
MPAGLDPIDGRRPAARPVAATFSWPVDETRPRDLPWVKSPAELRSTSPKRKVSITAIHSPGM